jgi:hypothetical protein
MADEIQEWQQLHDQAMRFAAFAAKKVATLKAVRKERMRSSHLRIVGVFIGGVGLAAAAVRAVTNQPRATLAGLAIGTAGGFGGASIACADDGARSREARPAPTIQVPDPRNPYQPPPVSRLRAPPIASPTPSPTQVPTTSPPMIRIPTTKLPEPLRTTIPTPPAHVGPPGDAVPTPPTRPPRPPRPPGPPVETVRCVLCLSIVLKILG